MKPTRKKDLPKPRLEVSPEWPSHWTVKLFLPGVADPVRIRRQPWRAHRAALGRAYKLADEMGYLPVYSTPEDNSSTTDLFLMIRWEDDPKVRVQVRKSCRGASWDYWPTEIWVGEAFFEEVGSEHNSKQNDARDHGRKVARRLKIPFREEEV